MPQLHSTLLAAIDRRLWRDLGFSEPEPDILPFLPLLVVAWADGHFGEGEAEMVREHAEEWELPPHLRQWVEERLLHPPGPYFRYQVAHLTAFLRTVWPQAEEGESGWAEEASQWADEVIAEAGWLRRLFGGLSAELRNRAELQKAIEKGGIVPSERIWALARGTHAQAEPERVVAVLQDHDQTAQLLGIVLHEPERIAVASYATIVRDDDLSADRVTTLLRESSHLHESERWIILAEEVNARGRPLTDRQKAEVRARLVARAGGDFSECAFAEQAYLEDALAMDARWMSWVPGQVEELRIDRNEVKRCQTPGTFQVPRHRVHAEVAQKTVPGPKGLGFRILHIEGDGQKLRLASPVLLQEPVTEEASQWIARFLPAMCDPHTQLVLDEEAGRWVAEVHPQMPCKASVTIEPLPAGRALLVPPWVWFRAAGALGARFFNGKRKVVRALTVV